MYTREMFQPNAGARDNPGLLDEALQSVPLGRIYDEAQAEIGYQASVIRASLRWFKRDFFSCINNPRCAKCTMPTIGRGMVAPLPDEQSRGASKTELYERSNPRIRNRWINVDVCEEARDSPLLYTEGWVMRHSYCIAFSADGCTDVTRRCDEDVLLHTLDEIRDLRRQHMSKTEQELLHAEDKRKAAELRDYQVQSLVSGLPMMNVD
ncbi:hypothetical protein CERZMDRAFT_115539 [Cercospora zeae-maydis SCOH1-5]|uniref:Uncharacterized protein n=1 Tax=Cercospora zeae-maydis SCOH1-5 TaxID=717836 RepID=A0A6A6EX18_9PEZI|nr:hypothetical protein CERZMDRAFT_115539 [Cercospora zeae-maydis SCOH1-5]